MKKRFTGIWATFEYLDDFCAAIESIRGEGYNRLTTHSPCYRHEIELALGQPQSRVPFAAFGGMILGFFTAVWLVSAMTLDWVLPVSAKPIVSIPVMGPISFEVAVLTAVYFIIFSMVYYTRRDARKSPVPDNRRYLEYDRFMDDRFGLVVPCLNKDIIRLRKLLEGHDAEEVYIEG